MNLGICIVGSALTGDSARPWLARRLVEVGLDVVWHVWVGEERDRIVPALLWLIENCDAIVVIGGSARGEVGLAASAVSEATGVPLEHVVLEQASAPADAKRVGAAAFEPIGDARGFALDITGSPAGSAVIYVLSGSDLELRAMAERHVLPDLVRRGETSVSPRNEERVENIVAQLLRESQLTVATAESCTAGAVTARLAAVPGASAYLRGGLVTYATEVKHSVLGIERQLLERHGPVSIPTTQAMARRAWQLFDADLGLGVTCVAGPDAQGGRKVGTTIWALATREGEEESGQLEIIGDRASVVRRAAACMLEILRRHLLSAGPSGAAG
ncbi:MAG: nicotinamide-nucleotide amidohydrolase family protein [Actinomycetota bacterium]|nr:nicotinamide-nucleotide amidohydrolase family protein [Actinomycetota bacterium]